MHQVIEIQQSYDGTVICQKLQAEFHDFIPKSALLKIIGVWGVLVFLGFFLVFFKVWKNFIGKWLTQWLFFTNW